MTSPMAGDCTCAMGSSAPARYRAAERRVLAVSLYRFIFGTKETEVLSFVSWPLMYIANGTTAEVTGMPSET